MNTERAQNGACGTANAAASIVKTAREQMSGFQSPSAEDLSLPVIGPAEAARLIDHTLLKPEATADAVRTLCREAVTYGFASVCVNPTWVRACHEWLAEAQRDMATDVSHHQPVVCTVIGFPLGATLTAVKVFETQAVIDAGAQEVDMVLNVGALRSGDYELVAQDIRAVVEAAHAGDALVKVIFENCLLCDAEKAIAARLCVEVGADFVKTSTGFNSGGATLHDVALMRHLVGAAAGVKAAGGVRTRDDLRKMVAVGATRIGASAGVAIVEALRV